MSTQRERQWFVGSILLIALGLGGCEKEVEAEEFTLPGYQEDE